MITDAFRYSTLIVGSATYSMRLFPEVESFMNAMETREIKNKVFATFSNFTWAAGAVTGKLKEYAERMKLPVSASLLVKQSAGAFNTRRSQGVCPSGCRGYEDNGRSITARYGEQGT